MTWHEPKAQAARKGHTWGCPCSSQQEKQRWIQRWAQAEYTRQGLRGQQKDRVPTSLKRALSAGAGSLGHILWTVSRHY